ncbi:MAG: SDR family NAD(P)-dependent oxidoreductase [Syntrophales bacterium]|nr:SDR family NAD(P)-dependent oxidoreductase [Syntrophales bacterium]
MDNPFSLSGKAILVTGASSGIGRQTCISISKMGGRVIATGRNEERLNGTLSMLAGNDHKLVRAELTDTNDMEALSGAVQGLNGIVHCAGIGKYIPSKFYKKEDLRRFNEINYEAPILLTSILLRKKKIIDNSSIIFISSIMSETGITGGGLYAGTKGALVAITRVIALELAAKKIRVNCISPALVKTPLIDHDEFRKEMETNLEKHPLGLGYPVDIANCCVFMLSDASKWITGTNLIIDGGYSAQ